MQQLECLVLITNARFLAGFFLTQTLADDIE
jgi:hypothetical protein